MELVTVCCITYNHEKFIRQALDGFLMQKTNFNFKIIIHDDASTDNTANIIREYAKNDSRIIPVLRENNLKSTGVAIFPILYNMAKGKYIATCEGDDYWTDPFKLQKQVDILEGDSKVGMVHTRFNVLCQTTKKIINPKFPKRKDYSFEELLVGKVGIATLTACFRKELFLRYDSDINPESKKWLLGDLPFWLYISRISSIRLIDTVTGTYRVLEESQSNSQNPHKLEEFERSVWKVRIFFLEKYAARNIALRKKIDSLYYYRQLLIFSRFKYNFREFSCLILRFFSVNTSFFLLLGSIKLIFRRFFPHLIFSSCSIISIL